MLLSEYIEQKFDELSKSNLYRDVRFYYAINVQLSRNGTSENFISEHADINKTVSDERSTLGEDFVDGVKIVFDILPNKKRKYTNISFYVIYK